jgi:elongation factor P--(R)-beta-lysine ligase
MSAPPPWRPSGTLESLRQRAALLARARDFVAQRGVLEVETPIVVNAAVTDVHIHSAEVLLAGSARTRFLHTSPEYAMKRLLASGSGDIYQICRVVRGEERSRLHNPEFTLIEWYRLGFSLERLMTEVEALVLALLGPGQAAARAVERITYAQAFLRELGIDPLAAPTAELAGLARTLGLVSGAAADRDELLEFIMATRVGPRLGLGKLCFVHGYPASQAALARLDTSDERTARRFELYCDGIELANGFHELSSAGEQRARFVRDNEERRRRALPYREIDEHLLAALEAGLPDCCGVALGFDRLLMLAAGATHIDEVLAFPGERA